MVVKLNSGHPICKAKLNCQFHSIYSLVLLGIQDPHKDQCVPHECWSLSGQADRDWNMSHYHFRRQHSPQNSPHLLNSYYLISQWDSWGHWYWLPVEKNSVIKEIYYTIQIVDFFFTCLPHVLSWSGVQPLVAMQATAPRLTQTLFPSQGYSLHTSCMYIAIYLYSK